MNLIKDMKDMKNLLKILINRVDMLEKKEDERYNEIKGKIEEISSDVCEIKEALIDNAKVMAERLQKKKKTGN